MTLDPATWPTRCHELFGSFFPLCARGSTKSTDMINEFLKILCLQLGASAANAFNHPNYAVPGNLTVGTSGFAQVTEVQTAERAGPRSIQLTARITF